MQHIKLFEEFVTTKYYKQIKDLPERGKIAVNADECETLQLALYKLNYRWPSGAHTDALPFEKHKEDENLKLYLGWYTVGNSNLIHPDKHKKLSGHPVDTSHLTILEFDDYFEPLDKYIGHHASKNYGV
jgi:hypothetical protein